VRRRAGCSAAVILLQLKSHAREALWPGWRLGGGLIMASPRSAKPSIPPGSSPVSTAINTGSTTGQQASSAVLAVLGTTGLRQAWLGRSGRHPALSALGAVTHSLSAPASAEQGSSEPSHTPVSSCCCWPPQNVPGAISNLLLDRIRPLFAGTGA
jgi:hypothetical protein